MGITFKNEEKTYRSFYRIVIEYEQLNARKLLLKSKKKKKNCGSWRVGELIKRS